jgi:hypothetical protein
LRLLHDDGLYEINDPEDYGNGVDYLDPEGPGWMGQLTGYWNALKSVLERSMASSGQTPEVLSADRLDGRELVKMRFGAESLPTAYQESFATSAEVWFYTDDGLPARLSFSFDLAPIHADYVDNADGQLAVDISIANWCWEEAKADGASGACVDRPVLFRWGKSADPASLLTLRVPDGYRELQPEDFGQPLPCPVETEDESRCVAGALVNPTETDAEGCLVVTMRHVQDSGMELQEYIAYLNRVTAAAGGELACFSVTTE